MNAKSYSSQARSIGTTVAEFGALFRLKRGEAATRRAGEIVGTARRAERRIKHRYGITVRDLDVLEVGVGQLLGHLAYFSVRNRVVGIDMDVIAQSANPIQYLHMLRANGLRRVAKTLGRKLTGFDRKFRREFVRAAGLHSWPHLKVLRMAAGNLSFASSSFDFVYSFEVFEHIPNPGLALDEIVRVLRPGGVACISFQLYTGPFGALDYAGTAKSRGEPEWWNHLRPEFKNSIDFQSVLNRLRLHQWRELFDAKMPHANLHFSRVQAQEFEAHAKILKNRGELDDYSLDELLIDGATVFWKKE